MGKREGGRGVGRWGRWEREGGRGEERCVRWGGKGSLGELGEVLEGWG